MPAIWSSGAYILAAHDLGLTLYKNEEPQFVVPLGVPRGPKIPLPKPGLTYEPNFIAVAEAADVVVCGYHNARAICYRLSEILNGNTQTAPTPLPLDIIAAACFDEQQIVLLRSDGEGPVSCVICRISPNGTISDERHMELPVSVEISSKLYEGYFDDEDDEEDALDTVIPPYEGSQGGCVANEHGLAIWVKECGAVALLPKGETSFTSAIHFRLPPEARIFAAPTAQGIIVSIVATAEHSELLHVDRHGSILAREMKGVRILWGMSAPVVRGDTVHVTGMLNGFELYEYTLPDLAMKFGKTITGPNYSSYEGLALSDSGKLIVISDVEAWVFSKAGKSWSGDPLERYKKPTVKVATSYEVDGDPALTLSMNCTESWAFTQDTPASIEFELGNKGGEGTVASIELGGDAISKGLLSGGQLLFAGEKYPLERSESVYRAAVMQPITPATASGDTRTESIRTSELSGRIEFLPIAAGSGLVTLRLKTSNGISVLSGKSLTVRMP